MDAVIEQVNSMGRAFVDFMWPMLWQSSVLIAILLALDFILRRKVRAVFRYWLWMLVFIKLVLPTTLSSPVGVGQFIGESIAAINITENNQPVGGDISNVPSHSSNSANSANVVEASVAPLATTVPVHSSSTAPTVSLIWQGGVFIVWLAIVAAMVLLLLQRAMFVCGLVRQAKEANDLKDMLGFCCKTMEVRGFVGLKVSPNATSPAVCGLFRPVILLPHGIGSNLGSGGLRVVLMHELAHIKRGDLLVNLLQTLLQIVYFYNPLLWLANWVIRRVREQAVDEKVQVALGEKAQQYPETLLNVARLAFERPALSLRLIGVVESKGALAGRIKRMLNQPIPKTAKLGIIGSLSVILLAAVLLPMAKAAKTAEQTAGDSKSTNTLFMARLDNGVTVELVGVCEFPSKGRQWWRPDGSPLGFDIETQDTSKYTDKNKAYQIAYKIEIANMVENQNDVGIGWPKIQGATAQSALSVINPESICAVRAHISVWGNSTTVKIPVTRSGWTTLGQTTGRGQNNTMVGSQTLMFGPAEGTREKLVVTTSDDIKSWDDYRLVAFDKQGNLYTSSKNWFSIKDLRQSTFVFVNLDPAAVDRFEFQTRPYEWVEFKNVTLKPGIKTDVKVVVEGSLAKAENEQHVINASEFAGSKLIKDESGKVTYRVNDKITLEILGITKWPVTKDSVWWSADGTVLDKSLSEDSDVKRITKISFGYKERENFNCYVVASRSDKPKEATVRFHAKSVSGREVGVPAMGGKDKFIYILNASEEAIKAGRVILTTLVSDDEWRTVKKFDVKGDAGSIGGEGFTYTTTNAGWSTTNVTLNSTEDFASYHETMPMDSRVIAIDKKGRIYTRNGGAGGVSTEGLHTQLLVFDLSKNSIDHLELQHRPFRVYEFRNVSFEPGAKTDVRVEAIQPIDFKIASSGFLDGDSITITGLAGSAGMIKPGNTYTVNGRYTLKSRDEAMLHIYATNGEVKSVQGPPVKRGEGEFTRTFTLLEDGDLHLSFYPAKGGNGFGGVYFAQKGAEVEEASRPVVDVQTKVARTETNTLTPQGTGDFASVTVQEGVGFDGFIVGDPNCTGEFIKSKLGEPDEEIKNEKQGWWISYRKKYGLDFWLNLMKRPDVRENTLCEIRMNKGFRGKLASGISMSSMKEDVFRVYDEPKAKKFSADLSLDGSHYENRVLYYSEESNPNGISKVYYNDKGLLFWFNGNEISQMVVYCPDNQDKGKLLKVYEINRNVNEFGQNKDFSTPEAAYASINRISASGESAGWQGASVKELAAKLAEESKRGKNEVEPEWAKVLLNTKILEVRICDGNNAIVIAQLLQEFSSEPIQQPIDVRYLKLEDGKWLNTGNDRVWTIEEARAMFYNLCEKSQAKAKEADKPGSAGGETN